jgi:hypothetical protein
LWTRRVAATNMLSCDGQPTRGRPPAWPWAGTYQVTKITYWLRAVSCEHGIEPSGPCFTLVSCLPYFSTLKMEVTCSSETSVLTSDYRRYIQEDRTHHFSILWKESIKIHYREHKSQEYGHSRSRLRPADSTFWCERF